MMDFSSTVVSPSFFPGLTFLTASLGSCFCLFPLLRAAGKVLLDLFHCLPCLMAPPEPSPNRMNSSRRAFTAVKQETTTTSRNWGQEHLAGSHTMGHQQPGLLGRPRVSSLGWGGVCSKPTPSQPHVGPASWQLSCHPVPCGCSWVQQQEAVGDSEGCAMPVVGAATS